METTEVTEEVEENEELQSTLYSALEELLFFLKQCPMTGSFKADPVRDMVKLGQGPERPRVNSYIMPIAASCLPMLFGFLSEGNLESIEDHVLCADTAASLLSMFPTLQAATLVDHIFLQVTNDPGCVVDLSKGKTEIFMKLTVTKPLGFKVGMAKALLRNNCCLTPAVMMYMTEPITIACYRHSSLTCLGFRTLHLWLSQWKKMDFCLDRVTSRNIYSIVADNWENQMAGVRKENVKVLGALLDVSCPTADFTVEGILKHLLEDLSWKMKSKYFYLSVLLPRVGVLEALQRHSCIIPALVATLGFTRLNSAGADTYQVCLNALPNVDGWCDWFLQPVLTLLASQKDKDRLAQLNLLSRWLTPTLRKFPSLTQILHSHLASLRSENPTVDLALSALMHQGRKQGYIGDLWPTYSFMDSFLVHADEEVRKNAFGAVCKKTKKNLVPPPCEFIAVKKFLKENINSDCTTLRQSVIDSFSHFLERLFESSVKLVANKGEKASAIFTFLKWMHEFLLENLKLGGNYQRTVTSLRLYLEILKWFGPGEVKTSGRADPLRSLGKDLDLWHFESPESWDVMLACTLHPTEDIQKVAGEILGRHLKLLEEEGAEHRVERVWLHTLQQCRSALFYEVESGRHVMQLLVGFITENPDCASIIPPPPEIVSETEGLEVLIILPKEPTPEPETGMRLLVSFWMREVERQWACMQEDVFGAMTSGAALHGALAGLLPLVPHFSKSDVACVLLRLGRISDHFLKWLSGQQDDSVAVSASFAEMTEAVNRMIPAEDASRDGILLSPSHQLVLSCLWLTLKETCKLAAALLCHSRTIGLDAVRCIMIVERILLRCRYKGTIEAAGAALATMVRHATSPQETRRCLPSFLPNCGEKLSEFLEDVLTRVLLGLSLYSNKTSVTRRSAGVAVLVQKIVAADSRPNKPLLQLCLRRLCEMVERPWSTLEDPMLESPTLDGSELDEPLSEELMLDELALEVPTPKDLLPDEPALELHTPEESKLMGAAQEMPMVEGLALDGPTSEVPLPEGPMPVEAALERDMLKWPMLEGVVPKGITMNGNVLKVLPLYGPMSRDLKLDGPEPKGLTLDGPKSKRLALDGPMPNGLTLKGSASEEPLPKELAPDKAMLGELLPDVSIPDRLPPYGSIPDGLPANGSVPDRHSPSGSVSDGIPPNGSIPDRLSPSGSVPDGLPANESLPEGLPANESIPEGLPANEFIPEGLPTNESVPDRLPPNGSIPDGLSPSGSVPDRLTPNGCLPEGLPPRGSLSDGLPPNGSIPDRLPPNGSVPDRLAPNGCVPDRLTPNGCTPDWLPTRVSLSDGLTSNGSVPDRLPLNGSIPDGLLPDGSVPEGLVLNDPMPELEMLAPEGPTSEECDLPQASALHLLCRLVQDASLRTELLPYSSTLALLCFGAFASPLWPVRNAALQLFGVLLPVLVGEKKVRNDDMESFGNMTMEEFISHHPSIVAFVLDEMQKACEDPESCKCLVPILSLLSKLTFGDSWSIVNCSREVKQIRTYSNLLVKSSRMTVRKLAAKCYSRFIPKNSLAESIGQLCTEMKEAESLGPNEFHGKVKLLEFMVLRLVEDRASVETFRCVRRLVQEVSLIEATWIGRMALVEVMLQLEKHCDDEGIYDYKKLVRVVIHVWGSYALVNDVEPGMETWAVRCIAFATAMCSESELCAMWVSLFANDWDSLSEVCVKGIQTRVPSLSVSTKEELAHTLLCCISNKWSKHQDLLCSVFTTILDLTAYVKINLSFRTICKVFNNTKEGSLPCWSVVLALCCELFARAIRNFKCISQPNKDFLRNLVLETHAQTLIDRWDEKTHVRTARAFAVLFRELSHLCCVERDVVTVPLYVDIVKVVLDCGTDLLQDENVSVRKEASKCLLPEPNPYVCLQTLLSVNGLLKVLSPFQIASYFQGKLLDFSSYEAVQNPDDSSEEDEAVTVSPFDTGNSNAALEEGHVLQTMAASFLALLEDNPPWVNDLPEPPAVCAVEELVTETLCKWKEAENGATSSMSRLNVLLLRLKVLAHVGAKLSTSSSAEDYDNLVKLVQSALCVH